jgi:hypothetical protein
MLGIIMLLDPGMILRGESGIHTAIIPPRSRTHILGNKPEASLLFSSLSQLSLVCLAPRSD